MNPVSGGAVVAGPQHLRVVHVIAPAPYGGAESVVRGLCVGAMRQGREPHVAALLQTADGSPFVEQLRREAIPVTEVRCGRRRYRAEAAALAELLARLGASVVHTHVYHADVVGYWAAQACGLAVVATVHGFTRGDLKNRFYQWLHLRLLRRFNAAICVSESVRSRVLGAGVPATRVHLVPNGYVEGERLSREQARETLGLPAQYNLSSGANPRTGVVVTANTTTTIAYTVAFSGGGGGVPGNIYEFGFDNGTFDVLITGNGSNPTSIGWQFDTVDFFRGTKSVKRNIPVNAANQAYAFFFLLNTPRKALYGRFAYKQGPNFDNSNPIKVFRYLAPSFGTQYGTVMFNANTFNLLQVNPDQIRGTPAFGSLSPNTPNPAIRPNASRGQWHWYEFFADYNTDGNYIIKVWQDDVLIIDGVVPRNISPLPNIGTVQIDGTFNSINTAEDVWYDSIGISTQKMGVPS